MRTPTPPKAGTVIEITIERMAYGGEAVGRYNGLAVFVPLAAPGEKLRVRITEIKKNFARATIEEVLTPAAGRREAPCRHFGECGGCQLQHMTYEAQLSAKAGFVHDALTRIGKLDWQHEIKVRAGAEFGYRARAQVKLERAEPDSQREIQIGFSRAGSHSVCDIEECPILVPELNNTLTSLRSALRNSASIDRAFPDARRRSEIEIAAGDSTVSCEPAVEGLPSGNLTRTVCGATYRFSPATFFQVNPFLLEALIEEAVGKMTGTSAVDLYAGVGLFTIQLARKFKRVVGIESDARAAGFARQNITANGISNVLLSTERVETALAEMVQTAKDNSWRPDLILLDPPRGGAAEAISRLVELRPLHISYVSCDPATLARDLSELTRGGYELTRVTAFDLFPQTYHVETVARLKLR